MGTLSTEKGQPVIHQRNQSPGMRAAKFVFHSAVAAYMITAYRALSAITERIVSEEAGGDLQFLTIWGFFMATITMVLSAICDVLPDNWLARASKRILALAAMPIELTISSIYWPLILFAPSLIVPPADPLADMTKIDAGAELFFIPLWMDLGLHLVPAVALLLDFFLLERKYTPPTSTRGAFLTALGVAISYATWVERCAAINGKFPYPFLTVASFENRCKIYTGAGIFALLVFWGLNSLHK